MKKRLSHFAYNERSRSSWTLTIPHFTPLSPIRSTIKTVTYVPGTFVTLVSGPHTPPSRGREERGGPNVPDETPVRNLSRRKLLDMAMQKTQREEGLMGLLSQHSNTPLLHFLTLAPRERDPGFPAPGDRLPRT